MSALWDFWYYTMSEVASLIFSICIHNGEVITLDGEVVLCI